MCLLFAVHLQAIKAIKEGLTFRNQLENATGEYMTFDYIDARTEGVRIRYYGIMRYEDENGDQIFVSRTDYIKQEIIVPKNIYISEMLNCISRFIQYRELLTCKDPEDYFLQDFKRAVCSDVIIPHNKNMIIEEGRYLNKYYGVYRDIILFDKKATIRFNAFMNDQLDITFEKVYSSEQDAINSVNAFVAQQVQNAPNISYSEESVKKINQSILTLLKDVVDRQVELPDNGEGYTYLGDLNHINDLLTRKDVRFVYWEE
jgi:hypothetical protein